MLWASIQKNPKSCHITPILRSTLAQNHWTHRIQAPLKFSWLSNLHTFISSSLKTTDRSFRYASPRLWNQLPLSEWSWLRSQLHSGTSSCISDSPIPSPVTFFSESPLSSSITPSFTPGLKPTCVKNPAPLFHFFLSDCLHWLLPGPSHLSYSFSPYFSFLGRAPD